MPESKKLFIFNLESIRHAISLDMVERVIRAVEVTPLPAATGNISGVINIHGAIVPVVDTRRMMGLPGRAIVPDDTFVLVRTRQRMLALVADSVEHVIAIPAGRIVPIGEITPGGHHMTGIARIENDVIMIHDLEECIKAEEFLKIDRALEEGD
jgi:purine-binding chemotaxis protein CheW